MSGIYDSYNARAKKTGYKSGAQDFYDKTMARTTAARTSGSALTDWLKENRDSFSYDDYTDLIGTIKQDQTELSKILDALKPYRTALNQSLALSSVFGTVPPYFSSFALSSSSLS